MKVLIIDDSRAMRVILKNAVKSFATEIAEAANGKLGLEVLKKAGLFDLVLVDWNMPEMNGLEFVKAVRADWMYADMKLVMVTTEVEMSQIYLAISAGANEYMMKPFTTEMLLEKLNIVGVETSAA